MIPARLTANHASLSGAGVAEIVPVAMTAPFGNGASARSQRAVAAEIGMPQRNCSWRGSLITISGPHCSNSPLSIRTSSRGMRWMPSGLTCCAFICACAPGTAPKIPAAAANIAAAALKKKEKGRRPARVRCISSLHFAMPLGGKLYERGLRPNDFAVWRSLRRRAARRNRRTYLARVTRLSRRSSVISRSSSETRSGDTAILARTTEFLSPEISGCHDSSFLPSARRR